MGNKTCLKCRDKYGGPPDNSELIDPFTNEVWGLCRKCLKFSGVNAKAIEIKLKLEGIKRKLRKKNGGGEDLNV